MQYELMNLSIGKNPNCREFSIGPYSFSLVSNYDEIISETSKEYESYPINQGERTTISTEAKTGSRFTTVVVTCGIEEPLALLGSELGGLSEQKGILDICFIFTYLTGRRVFVRENENRYCHIKHGQQIVSDLELINAAKAAWDHRSSFTTKESIRPLWYFLSIKDSPEVEIQLLCGSVALEIIINAEEKPKDTEEDQRDELTNLLNSLRETINESNIEEQLKNNFRSAIGKWGARNSKEKFKTFLRKLNIIDNESTDIALKRVDFIFDLRNGIAHEGKLNYPKWITTEPSKTNTAIFVANTIIPLIVEIYLNIQFGIEKFALPSQNIDLLKNYIQNGVWQHENIEGGT